MFARIAAIAWALLLTPLLALPLRAELLLQSNPPALVKVRPGVTIRYLALAKSGMTPAAGVILFAGGNGLLNLRRDGTIGTNLSGNFLVRSRTKFVQKGLFVAVVDTPNQLPIDGNVRLSLQYAQDMSHVIRDVRERLSEGGKVWLVGTSSGTLSAAGIAATCRARC